MKCVMCGSTTEHKIVEHQEFGVLLGRFPANICSKCGEVFFDERTADTIQKKSKEKGLFGLARKAKVAEIGNSIAIRIPKEIADFMNLVKGQEVTLIPEDKSGLHIQV